VITHFKELTPALINELIEDFTSATPAAAAG
jgi:phosphoglycolate phosphatase